MSEPSCPSCGEAPMFRSVVHECCERVVELEARLAELEADSE